MSLQEPEKKMSKSDDNESNYLGLLDPPVVLRKKIRRAVTDSNTEVDDEALNRPGLANLLGIIAALRDTTADSLLPEFLGKPYSAVKRAVEEEVVGRLEPFQAEYDRLMADKQHLSEILDQGAAHARYLARKTLSKVHRKVGFVAPGKA